MYRRWQYIKTFFRRIYRRFFRRSILSSQKDMVAAIIQKYQNVNYEERVWSDEALAYYTRGLISLLMWSKTFNFMLGTYLKNFVYPATLKNISQAAIIQKNTLKYILEEIKHTEFAKEHDLKLWDNFYHDFCNKVAISSYEDFKPRIEKAKTNPDIIWPGKITQFSASAGTTSRKKHIPVTDQSLESMSKAALDMLSTYNIKHPDTQIFSGYYRPLVGTVQEQFADGSIVSDVSALLVLDRSKLLLNKYKYDMDVILEPNRYVKRDLFVKKLHPKEKTIMMWVTSRIDEMLHHIQNKDPKKFQTFIKNLDLIIRGGVSAKPYVKYFNEIGVDHIWAYNASEGYFGYQDIINYANDQAQAPYQLLINHGIFYEFVPFTADNFDNGLLLPNAQVKPLREINKEDITSGTKFAMVITTNAWLFRYLLGDVISFVDTSYRFHIVGRTKQCINLKGEELMEDHVNFALQKINQKYHTEFKNYTIWPDADQEPTRHEWILEWKLSDDVYQDHIIKEIDVYLQEVNADYEAKRANDILLQLPVIHFVAEGTFSDWMQSKNKLGGQNKVPKLSSERTIVEELLQLTTK